MVDTSNFSFSQNPEDIEKQSLELEKKYSFWRWFIYLTLLFLGGGLSYGWFFLTQKLIPLMEKPVSNYISRPVKLGKIEAVSLTKIRLGKTQIDTTKNENDSAIAEAIEINFNPLQLFTKNIDFGITFIDSSIYLQQNKDNSWINLSLNNETNKILFWNFNVNSIHAKNSNLIVKNNNLQDLSASVTQLKISDANIIIEENQSLLEVKGNFVQGGNIKVNGLYKIPESQWLFNINGEDLATNTINNLIILPINANSGKVTGNIDLQFSQNVLTDIKGDINFDSVNFNLLNLPNPLTKSKGKVTFDNEKINLDNINTNLGLINTQVNGFITTNNQQLNIQANTSHPFEINSILSSLKLDKNNLEIKGKIKGKINITGDIYNPKIQANIVNVGKAEVDKISFENITSNIEIYNHQLSINNLKLLPTIGGEVTATGNVNLLGKENDSFNILFVGKNIQGKNLLSIYQQQLPINIGLISGKYNLSGNWKNFNQGKLTGFSTVELPQGGKAVVKNLEINRDSWKGEVALAKVNLRQLSNLDCEKFACNDSLLNGKFQISGKNQQINVNNIELFGDFNINFGGGKVNFINTKVSQGNWETLINTENFLFSLLPSINSTFLTMHQKKVNANLEVKGNLANNNNIEIQGKGKLDLSEGRINIDNFTLVKDNFIAETNAVNFALNGMGKNLRGDVSGNLTARGNINHLTAEKINLDGDLVFSQGISLINQPISANFSWNGENLKLNQAVSKGIEAKGIIDVDIPTQTVKNIDLDILATGIDLNNLSLPSSFDLLNYQGKVDFQGGLQGNISQPQLKGNVTLNNFQMANLAFSSLKGDITFGINEGLNLQLDSENSEEKISLQFDNQNQPQLINLQIKETQVKAIKNDDTLAINVFNIPLETITKTWLTHLPTDVKKIGGNLSGDVNVNLNNYELTTGNVIIDKPSINHLQGDKLTTKLSGEKGIIKLENGKLNHQKNEYLFAGELQPFRQNPQIKAKVEIKEGEIQNILNSWEIFELEDISLGLQPRKYGKAKDLYLEKTLSSPSITNNEEKTLPSPSITNGEEKTLSSSSITNDEEKTLPSSSITNDEEKTLSSPSITNDEEKTLPSPSITNNGEKTLPSPSITNSQPKPLASIEGSNNSLFDTLTFFRKVEAQLKESEANSLHGSLPSLETLQGNLTGSVDINLSFQEGIKAEFDLRGNNWLWGKYHGDSLQATGSYDNGLLTLLPVKINSNNSILSLTGTFKSERISGEVMLTDFSISQLKEIVNLPNLLNIDGIINASIAISGSEEKPLAKGNIEIQDSSINGTQIDKTKASFGFRNSRLDFLAKSNLTENTQPLTLIASLPFQLFPNSIIPENNDFIVSLNLTQDGFNLLDIITNNKLNWLQGQGDINLDIKGKYSQFGNKITDIDTQGIATFKNGVIGGKIFPDNPITNINGQVFFNFDQLNIPNLTGNFSGGNINIVGGLPLINNRFSDDSLNISVDDLTLDINSLYLGNAQGLINISNSALAPKISGKIKLYDGEIKVTENLNNNQNFNKNELAINTKIDNLELILGKNIIINQAPLLNLQAEGNLNINGQLNNLKPEGIINLKGGNLNLFTSQLKLSKNYNNIAKFTMDNGFEPYLDIQLEGSVTETLRYQLADNYNPNEIRDISNSSFNNAQTIKIKANVKGWSNNLENNIKLSSSPQRNQTEIIALLGGGFFNNFEEGDGNLGLANLASAAFLGSVQGQLQKEFGFDQLRLFPTQIFDTENRTSSFALGAELGLDITNNLFISITKILTNEQAPSYSIQYRLNDKTILRGSSDFEQDSRGIIEFEHRF
ncbi:protein of unknown function DUF490 [Geminocystis sp. NIES-3708]|uniref:translocation/assembly module TamB domain-containing protein n=1 Tax=Geminocystis sp. NIES-3708 TaxID=1615909 RepID=UPI0005FC7B14|nr:translocation/assembly module TamB domain-containing protein [Geminocystis sp. NIES-3708]BAQ60800.1 protein of unknown function DUF490 [Geminocystis sp. NIES-3708]